MQYSLYNYDKMFFFSSLDYGSSPFTLIELIVGIVQPPKIVDLHASVCVCMRLQSNINIFYSIPHIQVQYGVIQLGPLFRFRLTAYKS